MELSELKKLKSGTDIRGIALGDNLNLTDEAVDNIVRAFCSFLAHKTKKELKIAVGNDPRLSSPRIVKAVISALISSGADVVYTGLSSTPSMYMLLKESGYGCDASVMVTASHLPYDKNGLKFFTPEGGLSSADIDSVLAIAAQKAFMKGGGKYCERPFMDEYSKILVKKVTGACGETPLKGKKIIVDAGNGAGGFFAQKVLVPLGADVVGRFLEPDGRFPNHIPNPEDKYAIDGLSKAVTECGADLGIIFDTDVDRAACVDKNGAEINRDRLIALMAAILLPEKGGTIVTDSVTSIHLTEFIESLGGRHLRYKRGYKNVIDKCAELNGNGEYSPLAIETSGHAAFPENYYLDDGAYLITKILICLAERSKEGKSLTSLIDGLKLPAEECEIRLGATDPSDFKAKAESVLEGIRATAAKDPEISLSPDNYEGVRFVYGKSRVLVRMSVHDPVMPVNIESDEVGGTKTAAVKLWNIIKGYAFLNLENLKKYIG